MRDWIEFLMLLPSTVMILELSSQKHDGRWRSYSSVVHIRQRPLNICVLCIMNEGKSVVPRIPNLVRSDRNSLSLPTLGHLFFAAFCCFYAVGTRIKYRIFTRHFFTRRHHYTDIKHLSQWMVARVNGTSISNTDTTVVYSKIYCNWCTNRICFACGTRTRWEQYLKPSSAHIVSALNQRIGQYSKTFTAIRIRIL